MSVKWAAPSRTQTINSCVSYFPQTIYFPGFKEHLSGLCPQLINVLENYAETGFSEEKKE